MYAQITQTSIGKLAVLQTKLTAYSREQKSLIAGFSGLVHKGRSLAHPAAKLNDTETERLIHAVEQSQGVLIAAKTVFPFTMFPNTISIDRHKITIIHRSAVRTSQTISVQINDIQNIEADIGPLFGSISLTSTYFANNVQKINYLRRKEAVKIHRLLQGSIVAHRMHIDTSGIDRRQLMVLLGDLGQSSMR